MSGGKKTFNCQRWAKKTEPTEQWNSAKMRQKGIFTITQKRIRSSDINYKQMFSVEFRHLLAECRCVPSRSGFISMAQLYCFFCLFCSLMISWYSNEWRNYQHFCKFLVNLTPHNVANWLLSLSQTSGNKHTKHNPDWPIVFAQCCRL